MRRFPIQVVEVGDKTKCPSFNRREKKYYLKLKKRYEKDPIGNYRVVEEVL